jgi:hypothetical protein
MLTRAIDPSPDGNFERLRFTSGALLPLGGFKSANQFSDRNARFGVFCLYYPLLGSYSLGNTQDCDQTTVLSMVSAWI